MPQSAATPWWITVVPALIGVVGLLAGIYVTSFVTRNREQQQYMTRQRGDLYIDLLALYQAAVLERAVSSVDPNLVRQTSEGDEARLKARVLLFAGKPVQNALKVVQAVDDERAQVLLGQVTEPCTDEEEARQAMNQLNQQLIVAAGHLIGEVERDIQRTAK